MKENATAQNFEGKSNRGDIYEALENAVDIAKQSLRTDFVEWALITISGGYGGFVGAKDLTVSIEATSSRLSKESDNAGQSKGEVETTESGGGQVQVPVFLSGLVSKITGVDFCMDGATHRLETIVGMARLKAGNEDVQKFLDEVSGTRQRVAVAGYPVWGPECVYIRVSHAAPAEELIAQIGMKS
ncbi:MAG TPA: hypothetical protein VK308_06365 [Pyrinomonadaceae bacterium]|nr:hypothetical protein [Pyrinomonadaceae bacterium]